MTKIRNDEKLGQISFSEKESCHIPGRYFYGDKTFTNNSLRIGFRMFWEGDILCGKYLYITLNMWQFTLNFIQHIDMRKVKSAHMFMKVSTSIIVLTSEWNRFPGKILNKIK